MARINIEDQFWTDVMEVAARMGDSDKAVGQALKLIKFAQDEYKKGKRISVEDFRARFSDALIPEFARIDGDEVFVVGAEKHFDWLKKKVEAGSVGGKVSAKRPRDAKGRLKRSKQSPSKTKHSQASSSFSYSSSVSTSISHSSNNTLPIPNESAPIEINPVAFYCDLWKQKNGKSPDIRPKEAGQLSRLAKDVGLRRALEIMRAYFAMPDPFFIRRGYDVSTMLTNLTAISQFESNGKIVTKAVVDQVEKQIDKIQGTKKRRSIDELLAEKEAQQKRLVGGDDGNNA